MKLARWIVGLVLVLLLVWFAARESERSNSSAAVADSLARSPVESSPASLATDAASEARHEVDSSGAATTSNASSSEIVELHVVERGSNAPVADAEVHVLALEAASDLDSDVSLEDLGVLERLAIERGASFTSDADGVARITLHAASIVIASKQRLFGVFRCDQRVTTATIELAPADDLVVQVVDGANAPVGGIPIAFRCADDEVGATDRGRRVNGVANERGIAVLRRARFVVADPNHVTFAVSARIVATARVSTPIDPKDWPMDPIRLAIPPLVAVDVRVSDEANRPADATVGLVALRTPDESDREVAARPRFDRAEARTENGVAHFEFVAGDTQLRASADFRGTMLEKCASSPAHAGERVAIDLGGEREITVLHGRLLTSARKPMDDLDVDYLFDVRSVRRPSVQSSSYNGAMRLDSSGGFWITTNPSRGEPAIRRLQFWSSPESSVAAPASVELHLDGDLAPGIQELGDLVLVDQPLMISGIVVDDGGNPIADADVELAHAFPGEGGAIDWRLSGPGMSTAEDGKFSFHGPWSSGPIGLDVNVDGFIAREIQSFAVGAKDVRVQLRRGGTIEGSVVFDDGLSPDDFTLSCAPNGAPESEWERDGLLESPTRDSHRAAFKFEGLAPGKVRVTFSARGGPELLALDDVDVVAGKPSTDPRLNDVDLRHRTHAIHVVIRGGAGEAIESASVRVRARDGSRAWSERYANLGRVTLQTRTLPLDLVVAAVGYRTRRIEGVSADVDVKLERGLPIELALDSQSRGVLPAVVSLDVELTEGTLTTADDRPDFGGRTQLPPDGRATTRVSEPGRYSLSIELARPDPAHFATERITFTPATIEVRDANEVQKFEITLSTDELAKAKAFLGG